MRYKSIFSVSFEAQDDRSAQITAEAHRRQLFDELRVEGADHPQAFALERLIAEDGGGQRDVL